MIFVPFPRLVFPMPKPLFFAEAKVSQTTPHSTTAETCGGRSGVANSGMAVHSIVHRS